MNRISEFFKTDAFRNFINYLAIAAIFTESAVCRVSLTRLGIPWYNNYFKIYHFVLLFTAVILTIAMKRLLINKMFLFVFFIITCFSVHNILLGNARVRWFLPQFSAIIVHSLAFYLLFRFNKQDVKRLFRIYLNFAFFVGLIGLIQFFSYNIFKVTCRFQSLNPVAAAVGGIFDPDARYGCYFRPFFDYTWFFRSLPWRVTFSYSGLRVNSIMPEPSSFCVVMMPAFFTAAASFCLKDFRLFMSKGKNLVILASFLLAFSLIGYIGIFCTMLLLIFRLLKLRKIILAVTAVVLFTVLICTVNPDLRMRIEGSYRYLTGKSPLERVNQSTYTLVRNTLVTTDVLKGNGIIYGNGLGSHSTSYYRHSEKNRVKLIKTIGFLDYLNRGDASSLFLRLLSETGLFGLIAFLYFIARHYITKKNNAPDYLWVINASVLILFILRLLRHGNYISEGFFFFFWLYYFTKKIMVKINIQNTSIEKG